MPDLSSPFDPWTVAAAASDGPPALWAHRVTVTARRRPILSSVSLAVPAGAVVGLVGRNGAGKSTLLRALVGLVPLAEGECRLLGERSEDLTDAVRERLGYVAQTPDLFEHLNGRQHLERFGPLYPTFHWERALDLAQRLDLPMDTTARSLSLGDQQKLSVVLALGHDPDLLILDEPVASLDPLTRRDFMRTLFERRWVSQAPRTVLISSHLLGDLERVVSHVAFLRHGRLQVFDAWDALTEHVRLVDLPAGSPWAPPDDAVLHRRTADGRLRLLVDERQVGDEHVGIVAGGRSLNLDDLFVELNA